MSSIPVLVALDVPLRAGDAAFTFASPVPLRVGMGVIVPFGRRLAPGVVVGEGTPRSDLRSIVAVVGDTPVIPPAIVDLGAWVAREYLSSIGEALAAAVPWDALWSGLRLAVPGRLPENLPEAARGALETISRKPVTLTRAGRLVATIGVDALTVLAHTGTLTAALDGATASRRSRHAGTTPAAVVRPRDRSLSAAAARRIEREIRQAFLGGPRTWLIAGPHRTAVYMEAIRQALAARMSSIAAFASIEAASAFAGAASASGLRPALLHAGFSAADRLAAWRSLVGARGQLVVGTRAAIFAPVGEPVLAIVDDEDHSGHKEERAPRYLTRGVEAERTRAAGILIVGATTPTVATYAGVRDGSTRLLALPGPRPRIGIIDLRRRAAPDAPVSHPVLDAVRRTVRGGGRVLLLSDRKGYAGGLHCRECGAVERCPSCGVAMSYERAGRRLHCRFCGRTQTAPAVCPRCGGRSLTLLGAGTERIAAAARRITSSVWRLDRDALSEGDAISQVVGGFHARGGVLVATPVVLPWIESLRPDLVAVIAADRLLHRPEFRAAERALAFLRAVGIASGSMVLVETADPEHMAIRAATAPSLRPFYAEELAQRAALGYPPARSLIALTISGRSTGASSSAADAVAARLREDAPPATDVLGPTPQPGAPPRQMIVIKAADRAAARALVAPLLTGGGILRGVRLSADVDPHDL
ncbi:MAG: replication restart helicase PriA [Armatimonadota bacterium]